MMIPTPVRMAEGCMAPLPTVLHKRNLMLWL